MKVSPVKVRTQFSFAARPLDSGRAALLKDAP